MAKVFSVGRFDPAYPPASIGRRWCASRDGFAVSPISGRQRTVRSFRSTWMRHLAEMPYGTMDFLFVQLMQWGRDQGYRWFNLGMAPLSASNRAACADVGPDQLCCIAMAMRSTASRDCGRTRTSSRRHGITRAMSAPSDWAWRAG